MCFTRSWLRNLVVANCVNNIFHFDTHHKILSFVIIFDFSDKLTASLPFCLPNIHNISPQRKFDLRRNQHSHSRGVTNIELCCMGIISLFASHAAWERQKRALRHFPPRSLFVHVVNTSPARSSKIMNIQFSNHCVGIAASISFNNQFVLQSLLMFLDWMCSSVGWSHACEEA